MPDGLINRKTHNRNKQKNNAGDSELSSEKKRSLYRHKTEPLLEGNRASIGMKQSLCLYQTQSLIFRQQALLSK